MTQTQYAIILMALLMGASAPLHAADEEIEVYTDLQRPKGELGLDLHMSYVPRGEPGGEFPGGEASLHRFRLTPEISYGLGSGFEAAAYVPLLTVASDGVVRAEGYGGRIKWIAPHDPDHGLFWGAYAEVIRTTGTVEPNQWHGETKLIVGAHLGRWTLAANPTLGFKLGGVAPESPSVAINSKVAYRLSPRWTVGVESYNGLGDTPELVNFRTSEQSTYATLDTRLGHWHLHGGVGLGYGGNGDHVIGLLSVGVPLPAHLF